MFVPVLAMHIPDGFLNVPVSPVGCMTGVAAVQGFIFYDGGLVEMGFNMLIMEVISSFVGYAGVWVTALTGNPQSQLKKEYSRYVGSE